MMKQEDEKNRKFNEAIVNMLYPSPPSPQSSIPPPLERQHLQPAQAFIEGSAPDNVDSLDDYDQNGSTSSEDEGEHKFETEKLTRAQRKNIRKKKLKEEASRRGKLIGPLLPLSPATTSDQVSAEDAPPVRSNASEQGDEPNDASNSKKLKRRRMAKRLAKEKRTASTSENCNQSSVTSSAVDHTEAHM